MSTALTQLPGYIPIHRTPQQVRATRRPMRARYDAAQNTPENRKHWANADALSANAALSPATRAKLRERARYETTNNSYARGMQLTLAYDCIGAHGPALQIDSNENEDANSEVESRFAEWARDTNLADKLRVCRAALFDSGEAFGFMVNNPMLADVQLDWRVTEADQIAEPIQRSDGSVDGIRYDAAGNPVAYHLLKEHPGSGFTSGEGNWIPRADALHLYRQDRPGQGRGAPEATPALHLFAILRRYTLATLSAAETAAAYAMVLQTTALPGEEFQSLVPFEELEISRNMLTALPEGYTLNQTKPEQPTTGYDVFQRAVLNEIARCLNMPLNVALCNSSGYNYASGRLDHQTYDRSIAVDRQRIEQAILNRLFAAWFAEARLIPGYLPAGAQAQRWHWIWQSREHVDPTKAATAQKTRLESNTTTLAIECARDGNDWREILKQRKAEVQAELEIARMRAEIESLKKPTAPAPPEPQQQEDEDDE